MRNFKSTLALLVTSLALVACGSSDSSDDSENPQSLLRAVHLSPDAPAVNISVNEAIVLTDVIYRQGSNFLSVDPGSTDISVLVPALDDASALDATLDLEEDMKYTVIAANTVDNGLPLTSIVIIDDTNAPPAGNASITVVHGSPSAPAVDVYVSAPDEELPEDPLLVNAAFGFVSDELDVPAGDYNVRITPTGSTTVVYDSGTLSLVDGVEYIAIAADDINSESLVGITILTDLDSTPVVNVDNMQ